MPSSARAIDVVIRLRPRAIDVRALAWHATRHSRGSRAPCVACARAARGRAVGARGRRARWARAWVS
eukprot:2834302-Pleurochrysis_carterae.AAC.5